MRSNPLPNAARMHDGLAPLAVLLLLVVLLGAGWFAAAAAWPIFACATILAAIVLGVLVLRLIRSEARLRAALRDEIGRREAAEDALRQAQKMEAVGRLTGGVAHDFNNHLTVINSNIELLKRRLPQGSESLARLAEAAMQGVQRAATLAHRLLAFSRQQPADPEPSDAGRIVAGMTDLLRRTLGESVEVEAKLSTGLWQARVDPNQLENAMLNLAVNARDAMPGGGKLTIETANITLNDAYAATHADVEAGAYVMIAVGDTGMGMTPDVLARAFEPFFTTRPLGQGTGLGLSMVYGFVKQSGGHVRIDSVPGEGTTVRLYLPRHLDAAIAALPHVSASAAPADHTGETVLVVEDDEAVRHASVEALRDLGYQVLEAPDAMEAIRLIVDRGGIDLLFTDVGLPGGVNGRALADAARSASPMLKILFTTGYTRAGTTQSAAWHQDVQLLAKPFSLEQLGCMVRKVLDTPVSAEMLAVEPGA